MTLSRASASVLSAVLLVVAIVGLVVLLVAGKDVAPYLTFVAPIVAVLLVLIQGAQVQATQAQHSTALATISHQTNGVLTQRIQDAVSAALSAAGVASPAPAAPPLAVAPLDPSTVPAGPGA